MSYTHTHTYIYIYIFGIRLRDDKFHLSGVKVWMNPNLYERAPPRGALCVLPKSVSLLLSTINHLYKENSGNWGGPAHYQLLW